MEETRAPWGTPQRHRENVLAPHSSSQLAGSDQEHSWCMHEAGNKCWDKTTISFITKAAKSGGLLCRFTDLSHLLLPSLTQQFTTMVAINKKWAKLHRYLISVFTIQYAVLITTTWPARCKDGDESPKRGRKWHHVGTLYSGRRRLKA